MMKKVLMALVALALTIPSTAYSHERNRRHEHVQRERRDNTADVVLGILGGLIVTEALTSRYDDRRLETRVLIERMIVDRTITDPYNRHLNRRDCYYDGRADSYGRIYYVWVCQ